MVRVAHDGGPPQSNDHHGKRSIHASDDANEEFVLTRTTPFVFADLGGDVLDAAMVEVAAYCLEVA